MELDFTWKPEYSVGNVELDIQNRTFLQLCARARECAEGIQGDEHFHAVLNDLMQYALKHFNLEETVLEKNHYPEIEAQKSSHLEFIRTLTLYLEAAMCRHLKKQEVADFIWNWWLFHILKSDMRFRDTLMARKTK
ncbi:hemerythrin family protein [Rhodoferax sp. GW822-FHT02A01]|uniref:bacteriohemerythrin n=1 Tax=Rhodoferax sp. GW822-FHT02A01 TaxID=3141537 RepID=UPI00315D716F